MCQTKCSRDKALPYRRDKALPYRGDKALPYLYNEWVKPNQNYYHFK
ncbi:MAG: hypothetical protein RIS64_3617 [Bacteroidota bacterium]